MIAINHADVQRLTHKGHGRPVEVMFYGFGPTPDATGVPARIESSGGMVRITHGDTTDGLGAAGKFWAGPAPIENVSDRDGAPIQVGDTVAPVNTVTEALESDRIVVTGAGTYAGSGRRYVMGVYQNGGFARRDASRVRVIRCSGQDEEAIGADGAFSPAPVEVPDHTLVEHVSGEAPDQTPTAGDLVWFVSLGQVDRLLIGEITSIDDTTLVATVRYLGGNGATALDSGQGVRRALGQLVRIGPAWSPIVGEYVTVDEMAGAWQVQQVDSAFCHVTRPGNGCWANVSNVHPMAKLPEQTEPEPVDLMTLIAEYGAACSRAGMETASGASLAVLEMLGAEARGLLAQIKDRLAR